MSPTEKDYELVARWLDGEGVELTAPQRAMRDGVVGEMAAVGAALEVKVPTGTLHRAHARAVRACRKRLAMRRLGWAGAAAAAVIVAAAGLLVMSRTDRGSGISPRQYVESFLQAPPGQMDARTDLLADEIADYQVEISLGGSWPLEMALQGLAEEMGLFEPDAYSPSGRGGEEDLDELLW